MKPFLVQALSSTSNVCNWLTNSRQPKILHIFDHACNLINEDKEVLSIVTPQIGNGPFNLVVQDDVVFSDHLTIESPISILDNQITLGDLIINTANAQLWNPRPDWEILHAKRNEILDQLTSLSFPNYEILLPNSIISDFSSALVKADVTTAKSLTSQLAGLGIGLTPTGDDFMMGALYAGWIIHPHKVAESMAKEVANIAMPLTTSLSAAWLRSSGNGEAGELWHDFFDALIASNTSNIQLQIKKILSVGETSGADALAGFLNTFTCWANKA